MTRAPIGKLRVWLGSGSTKVKIQNNTFNFVGSATGAEASTLLFNGVYKCSRRDGERG